MQKVKSFLQLTLAILFITACTNEPKAPTSSELIIGKWEIQQGFRNGKRANSLEGLFFDFQADNQLVSNMFGAEQKDSYTLDDRMIKQTGSQEVTYTIDDISENQLTLSTTIRGYDFRLMLKKE